jgi:hypothetical protein
MNSWKDQLNGDTVGWLLEDDSPGVRYLALRDIVGLDAEDPVLVKARIDAHNNGPIATVLDAMDAEGYWSKPGPGYLPKYRSTVWSLITLGQLGASVEMDSRIQQACSYVLNHTLTEYGQFAASGTPGTTADCIQGNLCAALMYLGCDERRLESAYEWMARSVTGEGVAPLGDKTTPIRYYAGKCGPGFECGANNKLPCAWGATKVMLAFGKLPVVGQTPLIQDAIQMGVDFLLGVDPAEAAYPNGWNPKPSGNWWKFGFPVFYVTDLLQVVDVLVSLGYGADPRLRNALEFIREKQDGHGRWPLEYSYAGKTWVDFGAKKQPNKWVTRRAVRVLKAVGEVLQTW